MRIKMQHTNAEFPVYVDESSAMNMENRGWFKATEIEIVKEQTTTEHPEEGVENVES